MFGLGDELHLVVAGDPMLPERLFVVVEILAVDDQQFVLIELDFLGDARIEHGDSRAAVVEQEVLEFVEDALQHRHVDVFAVEVLVAAGLAVVAGFEDHVDDRAEWIKQFEEGVEQVGFAGGAHQHRHIGSGLFVAVAVVAVSLAGDDLEVVGWANGVSQVEIAIARHPQMRLEFFLAEVFKAARPHGDGTIAEDIAEESLEEAHRYVSRLFRLFRTSEPGTRLLRSSLGRLRNTAVRSALCLQRHARLFAGDATKP